MRNSQRFCLLASALLTYANAAENSKKGLVGEGLTNWAGNVKYAAGREIKP